MKELVAEYLSSLKTKTGLSYEAIAKESQSPESTVKNLCLGKTDDPRLSTFAPIVYAMGGSIDEMYNRATKDEVKKTSITSLKDTYEYDIQIMKDSYEAQVNNIRTHYEQHHEDLKENFERRLADKIELIDMQREHIKALEKESRNNKIAFYACCAIFVCVLIAELLNPNLGWFRY